MICSKCGAFMKEDAMTCPSCGTSVEEMRKGIPAEEGKGTGQCGETAARKTGRWTPLRLAALGMVLLQFVFMWLPCFATLNLSSTLSKPFSAVSKQWNESSVFSFPLDFEEPLLFIFPLIMLYGMAVVLWTILVKHQEGRDSGLMPMSPVKHFREKAKEKLLKRGDGYLVLSGGLTSITSNIVLGLVGIYLNSNKYNIPLYETRAGFWLTSACGLIIGVIGFLMIREYKRNARQDG